MPVARYSGRGRPSKGTVPEVMGYRLQREVVAREDILESTRRSLGRFILATNELDAHQLSPEAMLSQYKAQGISVERGFRFLKDPPFFADSLFFKNPGRTMALISSAHLKKLLFAPSLRCGMWAVKVILIDAK